jgi:uncharacterized protein with FMN-binding domain
MVAWLASAAGGAERVQRTRQEVDALVEAQGAKRPEWWYDVKLVYPETLDMNWPLRASGDWNNQVHVGQYIWDIINPNPDRWQEGIRLVHHLLMKHLFDENRKARSMGALGSMFYHFRHDWPRAIFWWTLSERFGGSQPKPLLADCYWKLGCNDAARELLAAFPADHTRSGQVIKLHAEMGQLPQALKLAETKAEAGMPQIACLAAGNACRRAGRYQEALEYYHQAAKAPLADAENRDAARAQAQAKEAVNAILLYEMLASKPFQDGVYQGVATAFNGPLQVEVKIADGRIESAQVEQHREKQFYRSLADAQQQIVERQSTRGIDAVTGATITSQAVFNAAAEALGKALP